MATTLPTATKRHLEKCQVVALSAVESYNRPGSRFRTGLYVVLIVMAWQAFFHAYFYKKKRKPWYKSRESNHKSAVRYEKIDGEPKHWDLSMCLHEYFRDLNPPERKNLEFLLGLRNKIEHRDFPQFDATLYGECQSALMNLENYLVSEFGAKFGLSDSLAVSLQFSRIRPTEQLESLKSMAGEARTVLEYIKKFRTGLSDEVLNDSGYAYRVFLVPMPANRKSTADAAIQFVHADELSDELKATIQELTVLRKNKHVPVSNLDNQKPAEVVKAVSSAIPFVFKMHHHTSAWKHFKVRPNSSSERPEVTASAYCIYDRAHKDYLYTNAWTNKLISELSVSTNFLQVTGRKPVEKTRSR